MNVVVGILYDPSSAKKDDEENGEEQMILNVFSAGSLISLIPLSICIFLKIFINLSYGGIAIIFSILQTILVGGGLYVDGKTGITYKEITYFFIRVSPKMYCGGEILDVKTQMRNRAHIFNQNIPQHCQHLYHR